MISLKIPDIFIYTRKSPFWDTENVCKVGISDNIVDRESSYITYELERGAYLNIFKCKNIDRLLLDDLIKDNFEYLNIYNDAGTELYDKKILEEIEPFLDSQGIEYESLAQDEINSLERKIREKHKSIVDKQKKDRCDRRLIRAMEQVSLKHEKNILYTPRDDQNIIIEKSVIHFQKYDKGALILICGVGKTLISLWITQKLKSNTICIGVPTEQLLNQWKKVINILFKDFPILIVSKNKSIEDITRFLENNKKKCIIITTYASSCKVKIATKKINFILNMKILDEFHHLTSSNMDIKSDKKTYTNILLIESQKQLSLTATIKQVENNYNNDGIVISNDNVDYFGEIIDRKCLLWAIEQNILCDYDIQTIITDGEDLENLLEKFNITEEKDKRLFLSAYISLKSILDGQCNHLLIYSNKIEHTLILKKYIKQLLENNYFNIPTLYYSEYDSNKESEDKKHILNNFNKANYGIITCVYCLSEGYDNYRIDGVVFSENMTSDIRILQSGLRPHRKNKENINKKAKIIIPILNNIDWLECENSDFKKAREIIYLMGLEDETITQKIKVYKINIKKQLEHIKEEKKTENTSDFGEYNDELTKQLRMKTVKRIALDITYEKAIKIIADKNIKNKESYRELCDRDNRLSPEPEITFKGKFTTWIEYLSIKKDSYYNLVTCKNKATEYLLLHPEIKKYYLDLSKVCYELCKIDIMFPPNGLWVEYYNIKDLSDIIIIKSMKKKSGIY
jgi:superfamily II DNA or RNA helicase